jgi:hypothetical protein
MKLFWFLKTRFFRVLSYEAVNTHFVVIITHVQHMYGMLLSANALILKTLEFIVLLTEFHYKTMDTE